MTDAPFVYEVTDPFDEPYYRGSGARAPEDYGMPVALDGRAFLVNLTPETYQMRFQRNAIQLLNNQQQDSSGDQSLITPEVWRRIVESWHFGDGQNRSDRKASLDYRYKSSDGIDVWDEWGISLLRDTASILDLPAGAAMMVSLSVDSLWVGVAGQGWWWTGLSVGAFPPDAPTVMSMPETTVSACSDGTNLYTLGSSGVIRKWTDATTPTVFASVSPFDPAKAVLRYVKGFLVVGTGPTLYDVTSGTQTTIFVHPLVDWRWVDMCEGLADGFLLGGIGDRWLVYSMTVNPDAVTLAPPIVAAPIPEGEVGYALDSYLGYVVVGTSAGWHFGVPSSGQLTFGRLVKTDTPVRCFEGQDRFVWFGRSTGAGSAAGLGRADLSSFVQPMTPASANDLASDVDGGTVRAVTTVGAGAGGLGARALLGRRVFTVDGEGVYMEADNLVPIGSLDQGLMTFGTSDWKMGLYAQVYCDPLSGGVSVNVALDGGTSHPVAEATAEDVLTLGNIPLAERFSTVEFSFTLTRDPTVPTLGPRMTRLEFRAIPVEGRASEWRVPLLLHDEVTYDNISQLRDVVSDFDLLMDLVESRREFNYREGSRVYRVHATDFIWMPHHLTLNGEVYNGTFMIVLREVR